MKPAQPIVLDASVALTWCFPDEHSAFAYRVLDYLDQSPALVPSLWPLEISNALLVGERRHRLSASDLAQYVELLNGLPIEFDPHTPTRSLTSILALARSLNLSSYDAAYLELAMREGLILATLDARLRAAAKSSGVKLFV